MTTCRTNPLYRVARQISRGLEKRQQRSGGPRSVLHARAHYVANAFDSFARTWHRARLAQSHGLHLAAASVEQILFADAQRLLGYTQELLEWREFDPSPPAMQLPASPFLLIEELQGLQEEFGDLDIDYREQKLIVRTEPIELQETALGPFAIQLNIRRLADRADSDVFRCIALKPNPAANDSGVTHPHVKNEVLCAGEATLPISQALQQGRLCDAFMLVRCVLRTYNAQSPYISLDDWGGVTCPDCDCSTQRDRLSFCEHCDRDVCDECSGSCDMCDQICCSSCLEYDANSRKHCCPNCRHTCSNCNRVVDSDSFDEESMLCPQCLAEANAEAEESEETRESVVTDETEPPDNSNPEDADELPLQSQPESPEPPDRGIEILVNTIINATADPGGDSLTARDGADAVSNSDRTASAPTAT